MEIWHLPYESILDIPWSRRHRMFRKKEDLEKRRDNARKQAESRARARR